MEKLGALMEGFFAVSLAVHLLCSVSYVVSVSDLPCCSFVVILSL